MDKVLSLIEHYGYLVVLFGVMLESTFNFYNALGGAVWATAAVSVGYLLGGSLGMVERRTGRASALLAGLMIIGVVLYLAYRWVVSHPELIERAFPRLGGERVRA